jgi:hypothetical protein
MLCQEVGVPQSELQEFTHNFIFVNTVVKRFNVVPIYSKIIFFIFYSHISLVCRSDWFSVALSLYLWESKNFVWLLERMLLLLECIGFVQFVREECIF